SVKLLHTALEQGINFFDTARQYGRSEEIFGNAFKQKRDAVVISSKCRHLPKIDGQLPPRAILRKFIKNSFQESLVALQTDYIDLFMLHSAELPNLKNPTVQETFVNLKQSGRVRAIGVSTYSVAETRFAIEQGIWDVIQVSCNLMDQRQVALFEKAAAAGIGLMVRSVLLKGILSDRGRNLHPALQRISDQRDRYQELLTENIPTLSKLATKFALSFSEVASVLVGIDRMEYLEQAVDTADGKYLDADALARAKELAFPEPEFLDLPKWDREGWLR
ncbi:aldo/keto reductase, partial [bacterium]|nr:aldo/keto reductase [bacterium]